MLVCHDDCLPREAQQEVYDHLMQPGWQFGWQSDPASDRFSFWHKHFAGALMPADGPDAPAERDCAGDLAITAPPLHRLWLRLTATVLKGHRLVRCYANGHAFGSEGTLHIDTRSKTGRTSIYYPHLAWEPNWGGETVFFNTDRSDIVAAVYPRPNRLLTFAGAIPHVARGVSRVCPQMRVTLMFKTEQVALSGINTA